MCQIMQKTAAVDIYNSVWLSKWIQTLLTNHICYFVFRYESLIGLIAFRHWIAHLYAHYITARGFKTSCRKQGVLRIDSTGSDQGVHGFIYIFPDHFGIDLNLGGSYLNTHTLHKCDLWIAALLGRPIGFMVLISDRI